MHPVLLAIIASVFWGVGTAMQKHGMSTNFPKISLGRFFREIGNVLRTLVSTPIWLLGLVSMGGGMVSFASALGKGDLTVVQPIVGLTGVVAALIGVIILGERMIAREWVGIATILAGVTLVSAFSGKPTAVMPSDMALMGFTGLTIVLTTAALALRRLGVTAEFTLSFAAGLVFGLGNLMGKLLTQRAIMDAGPPFSLLRGAVWGSALTDYPVYIIIAVNIIGGAFFQTAFANGRAGVVSPIVTIVSTILPILAAVTIFGERVSAGQAVGMLIVLVGTALLARRDTSGGAAIPIESQAGG